MLLPSKNGIKCDICGTIHKLKFVYYSYDCHKICVDIERAETSKEKITDVNDSIIGFDVCEKCHNDLIKKMLDNQKHN